MEEVEEAGWGAGNTVNIRGHGLIACFIYFLMLTWAECRRSTWFVRCTGEHTKKPETPTADLIDVEGGSGVSGHRSLPVLCIHSGLIFNEDCRRTGTSLKRGILRLSCLPLNLTADLSHYLLSSLLRRWGTSGFEKSHLACNMHPLTEFCTLLFVHGVHGWNNSKTSQNVANFFYFFCII